jgi:phage nucleotide-binding protein
MSIFKKYEPTDHFIKALVYGPSGSGKTVFSSTAPKPVILSAEAGLLSLAGRSDVDYAVINSMDDLKLAFLELKKGTEYKTIVIDSITEINEVIKASIERRTGKKMQLQDWGELAKQIRDLLRAYRDLPYHVIFIAQEEVEKDEDRIVKYVPQLNGKSKDAIAYFMDVVGYTYIDKLGAHKITVAPNEKLLTKSRMPSLLADTPTDFSEWIAMLKTEATTPKKIT